MGHYCCKCKKPISKNVHAYSTKHFDAILCREHQPTIGEKVSIPVQSTISPRKFAYTPAIRNRGGLPRTANRKISTPQALKIGQLLQERGYKVEYEKFDGFKHIDIAIVEAKVNIEVDGTHHSSNPKQALADLKRTFYSFKKGYLTLRIPNSLTANDKTLHETAEFISIFLRESKEQLEQDERENH